MLIILEGPNKAGKSSLAKKILEGFWPEKSKTIHWTGEDKAEGFGYMRSFIYWLDHPWPCVFDRAWVGEFVYGKLLQQPRFFAEDPFVAEWFYSRALQGRGEKYIVLPEDNSKLAELRDEGDFPEIEISSVEESRTFEIYGARWGYKILKNDYTLETQNGFAVAARKSVCVPVHKVPSTDYIGSLNPSWTFIGDSRQGFSFQNRPFFNEYAAEYFRPFGLEAITDFGYSTVEGYLSNKRARPELFKRPIAVGHKASHLFPELPSLEYRQESIKIQDLIKFREGFEEIKHDRFG